MRRSTGRARALGLAALLATAALVVGCGAAEQHDATTTSSSSSGAGGAPGSGDGGGAAGGTSPGSGGAAAGWWKPAPGTSWQWQLSGKLDPTFDVDVYDIDLFDNTQAQMNSLHAAGRKVVCYFDTAYEPGRPDSDKLKPYRGNPVDGWPGQYWLDVTAPAVVAVMHARIDLAKQKRCDGIEADDVDARSNDPGFPTTAAQQQAFIRDLADTAHARGIAFGLKNDLEEISKLLDDSDFAINEECFRYHECNGLKPFITANKAVFQVEYTSGDLMTKGETICPQANAMNFDTLIKHLDLNPPRYSCR